MGKYLIILSLFLTISLWSQRPPYKEFNVDNGLPSNTVRCVFKDSKGLISDFREMKIELDEIKNQLRKYKAYFYALVTLIGIGALKVIIQFLTSK